MLKLTSQLLCDRCGVGFRREFTHLEKLDREELNRIRAAAHLCGWSRCRPKTSLPMGDFCKTCADRMQADQRHKSSKVKQ
jgi:hypothetical protein